MKGGGGALEGGHWSGGRSNSGLILIRLNSFTFMSSCSSSDWVFTAVWMGQVVNQENYDCGPSFEPVLFLSEMIVLNLSAEQMYFHNALFNLVCMS